MNKKAEKLFKEKAEEHLRYVSKGEICPICGRQMQFISGAITKWEDEPDFERNEDEIYRGEGSSYFKEMGSKIFNCLLMLMMHMNEIYDFDTVQIIYECPVCKIQKVVGYQWP